MSTHPTFKSAEPIITDIERVQDLLGHVLENQKTFNRRTSPFEFKQWNNEEFHKFEVKLEDIDRLYHIEYYADYYKDNYRMTFRMQYKENLYYVDLSAFCHPEGFDIWGGGCLYITRHPCIFADLIVKSLPNKEFIYQFLREDGIQASSITKFVRREYKRCTDNCNYIIQRC